MNNVQKNQLKTLVTPKDLWSRV